MRSWYKNPPEAKTNKIVRFLIWQLKKNKK